MLLVPLYRTLRHVGTWWWASVFYHGEGNLHLHSCEKKQEIIYFVLKIHMLKLFCPAERNLLSEINRISLTRLQSLSHYPLIGLAQSLYPSCSLSAPVESARAGLFLSPASVVSWHQALMLWLSQSSSAWIPLGCPWVQSVILLQRWPDSWTSL